MGKLFDNPTLVLILVVAVIVIFGSKRLPDAARGVGRSLRILKAETKGLMTDEEEAAQPAQQVVQPAQTPQAVAPQPVAPPVQPTVAPPAPQPAAQQVAPPADPPAAPQPAAPQPAAPQPVAQPPEQQG